MLNPCMSAMPGEEGAAAPALPRWLCPPRSGRSLKLPHDAAVSTTSPLIVLPTSPCAAGGTGGSGFWESCALEATAPPTTVGKITEGTLKRLGRGTRRNVSFPQADRLLRANSREKSAVAQLHLFVSSLFVHQGGIIVTWIYTLLRFLLCIAVREVPDTAGSRFTRCQTCVWQSGSIHALERPGLMD